MLIQKMTEFVPVFEALQPPGSGMQALCGLHWSIERAKLFLYRTVNSSKLYLVILATLPLSCLHLYYMKNGLFLVL
jgi:hypothetical protein